MQIALEDFLGIQFSSSFPNLPSIIKVNKWQQPASEMLVMRVIEKLTSLCLLPSSEPSCEMRSGWLNTVSAVSANNLIPTLIACLPCFPHWI